MHELSTLLDGAPWVPWGPTVHRPISDRVLELVAARVLAIADCDDPRVHALGDALIAAPPRRFIMVERLSNTPHAIVYIAVDRLLGHKVVVKIHRNVDAHAGHRAVREAQAQARTEHPNVTAIHDIGEHDEAFYSVLEPCDTTLTKWAGSVPWPELLDRLIEAGEGLAHVHRLGLIHCDVKPSNILIKGGIAKLADFGGARMPNRWAPVITGTAGFIAPEVPVLGVSPEADVFSLAVTAWVCLLGTSPHGSPPPEIGNDERLAWAIRRAAQWELEKPASLPPGLPRRLLDALADAMHPDPRRRLPLDVLLDEMRLIGDRRRRRRQWARQAPATAVLCAVFATCGWLGKCEKGPKPAIMHAVLDPLTLAEIAARNSEPEVAVEYVTRASMELRRAPQSELERGLGALDRIAEILTSTGASREAEMVAFHAFWLRYGGHGTSSPSKQVTVPSSLQTPSKQK